MDTKHPEKIAEELISHKLQDAGMLVAEPKFDRKGTDLLAFADMGDGVRFCRIQCKYRSLETGKNDVKIPCSYVTNGFIVFVYIKAKKKYLYCFFASDVRQWPKTRNDNYRLALSLSNFESRLKCYLFDDSKVRLTEALIRSAETSKEFQSLVHGHASITLAPARVVATGECVGGERLDPPLDGFPLLAHDPAHSVKRSTPRMAGPACAILRLRSFTP